MIRLIKSALTFGDWLPYALWKLNRHSGVTIELTERQRRHPLIFGWPVLIRLIRRTDDPMGPRRLRAAGRLLVIRGLRWQKKPTFMTTSDGGTVASQVEAAQVDHSPAALRRRYTTLFRPKPWLYYADMLASACHRLERVRDRRPRRPVLGGCGWLAVVVATFSLYRAVLFIHELAHLKRNSVPGLRGGLVPAGRLPAAGAEPDVRGLPRRASPPRRSSAPTRIPSTRPSASGARPRSSARSCR